MNGAWVLLALAAAGEILWAGSLARSEGFRHLGWAALSTAAAVVTILCLGLALRRLPLSAAYAIWTGTGIVGTTLIGLAMGEALGLRRALCLSLILVGVVGLHLDLRGSGS